MQGQTLSPTKVSATCLARVPSSPLAARAGVLRVPHFSCTTMCLPSHAPKPSLQYMQIPDRLQVQHRTNAQSALLKQGAALPMYLAQQSGDVLEHVYTLGVSRLLRLPRAHQPLLWLSQGPETWMLRHRTQAPWCALSLWCGSYTQFVMLLSVCGGACPLCEDLGRTAGALYMTMPLNRIHDRFAVECA